MLKAATPNKAPRPAVWSSSDPAQSTSIQKAARDGGLFLLRFVQSHSAEILNEIRVRPCTD